MSRVTQTVCDRCGAKAHGVGYSHISAKRAPGSLIEWDVCPDCFYALFYKMPKPATEQRGGKDEP